VLQVIEKEKLLENVAANSGPWLQELQKLVDEFPHQLKAVRGKGYLIGLQFSGETAPVQAALREGGLLAPTAGGNVIRLLPPLIATRAELNRSVEILRAVLKAKA
jgi:acetylornithine aminotransferase/acetylornithine/N-succinyldiaminopimelate aminotransferase